MGNIHSVNQAFKKLNKPLGIVRTPEEIKNYEALILPGVGAFDPAMENLQKTGMVPSIKLWVKEDKPLLGICLGLQLLFESSEEGSTPGLGLLKGHVRKLQDNPGERIPHMGWALLNQLQRCPLLDENDKVDQWVYFVHSYSAITSDKKDLAASTTFGDQVLSAIVWRGRLGACQFHPEKSSTTGQKMLSRWLKWLDQGAKSLT